MEVGFLFEVGLFGSYKSVVEFQVFLVVKSKWVGFSLSSLEILVGSFKSQLLAVFYKATEVRKACHPANC